MERSECSACLTGREINIGGQFMTNARCSRSLANFVANLIYFFPLWKREREAQTLLGLKSENRHKRTKRRGRKF